ncbi:MAG: GntR family transcriptional regulator [Pseudomonadota bacterium]
MPDYDSQQNEPRPKTTTALAVERLKSMILSGELSARSDHLESELAARLGMSRTPVREATLVLQSLGLLEVRPRKGVRIRPVTIDDMKEVYEVLTELESLAAARAAGFGYDRTDLAILAETIERMEDALAAENREAWAAADEDFHSELVRLGRNQRLAEIVNNFNDQVRRARTATLYARPLPTRSNEDHSALFDAILSGDVERAQEVHRGHRIRARQLLTELLTKLGLRYI